MSDGCGAPVGEVVDVGAPVVLARTGESVAGGVGDGAVGVHPHPGVVVGFGEVVLPAQGVQVRSTGGPVFVPFHGVVDFVSGVVAMAFRFRAFRIRGEDVVAQFLGGFVSGAAVVEEVAGDRFEGPAPPRVALGGELSGVVGVDGSVAEDFPGVVGEVQQGGQVDQDADVDAGVSVHAGQGTGGGQGVGGGSDGGEEGVGAGGVPATRAGSRFISESVVPSPCWCRPRAGWWPSR